jgi:hypothetical protein
MFGVLQRACCASGCTSTTPSVGRLNAGDLAFPEPPPANEPAALAAAAAHVEGVEGIGEQGGDQGGSQDGSHKELNQAQQAQQHTIHASAATNGGMLADGGVPGKVAAGPSLAARLAQPALLPPQMPSTPSRGMQAGARRVVTQAR